MNRKIKRPLFQQAMSRTNITSPVLKFMKSFLVHLSPRKMLRTPVSFVFYLSAIFVSIIFVYICLSGGKTAVCGDFVKNLWGMIIFIAFCETVAEIGEP